MSDLSSAEPDSWTGDSRSQDSGTRGSARSIPSAARCSNVDTPECPSMEMFETSMERQIEWIYSPEDSPASPSVQPVNAGGSRTNVGSGPNSHDSFAHYDQATFSWRTSQGSLLDTEGWGESLQTWPSAGMTRSGIAYSLQASERPTVERESLSLPTPRAQLGTKRNSTPWIRPLDQPQNLENAVARLETFKTPTAAPWSHGGSGGELHKQVAPNGGPLNPEWVEWLMGCPIGWTDLQLLETAWSLRSRDGSGNAFWNLNEDEGALS